MARPPRPSDLYSLRIPTEPRLSLLLQLKDSSAFGRGATTADAIGYGASMLRRFPVDWAAAGE